MNEYRVAGVRASTSSSSLKHTVRWELHCTTMFAPSERLVYHPFG
jgi:hypothetical protein